MFASGIVLGLVLGAGAGAIVAWAMARARAARDSADATARAAGELAVAQTRLEERDRHVAMLQQRLDEAAASLEIANDDLASLRAEQAALEARADEKHRAAEEQLALAQSVVQQADEKLREAFASLSSDALQRNNRSFIELAKETLGSFQQQATGDLSKRQQAIDELVRPIRETLDKFDAKIADVEKARIEQYSTLGEQVRSLLDTQQKLESETANLVKALRTPHVRGQWGEIQLRRVVELAGMLSYCDFNEQQTAHTEDGRLRPDVVVQLPGGKSVVVDAKSPLTSYLAAIEASDDTSRDAMLREHARQVREHIGKLSNKQYWAQFQPAPEFVVMFLPGETFFSAALQHDPSLIEYGIDQRVIVASPTTLIALLRAVAYGWNQERIQESAQAISALGRQLYDRLQTMATHFDDLRKRLDGAVDAYNRTVGSLEGRVLVSARRFGELGVATTGPISELSTIDRTTRALNMPIGAEDEDEAPVDPDAPPAYLTAEA